MSQSTSSLRTIEQQPPPLWRDIRILQLVGQFVFALVVILVAFQLVDNVLTALDRLGRVPDFRFWEPGNFFQQPARFEVSEGPGFTSSDSFGRAFAVGVINTLRAVAVGLVLATLLGLVIGVARLSRNFLLKAIASVYVEIFQNTPLLVQLIFIYRGVYLTLPQIDNALVLPGQAYQESILRITVYLVLVVIGVSAVWYLNGLLRAQRGAGSAPSPRDLRNRIALVVAVIVVVVLALFLIPENTAYLSQRGLNIPAIVPTETFLPWLAIVCVGLVLAGLIWLWRARYQKRTGQPGYRGLFAVAVFLAAVVGGWIAVGAAPFVLEMPAPVIATLSDGRQVIRRIAGGEVVTPEYAALLTGLVLYTAAFIGEVVRAGIQAVPHGQIEAARALGLAPLQTLQLVILPQALRIIIPPLGNQYLNLTKNSSLATAIGFADLFSVSKTIMHQSGQDVVMISAVMLTYLAASLSIAAVMNWLNGRLRLKER